MPCKETKQHVKSSQTRSVGPLARFLILQPISCHGSRRALQNQSWTRHGKRKREANECALRSLLRLCVFVVPYDVYHHVVVTNDQVCKRWWYVGRNRYPKCRHKLSSMEAPQLTKVNRTKRWYNSLLKHGLPQEICRSIGVNPIMLSSRHVGKIKAIQLQLQVHGLPQRYQRYVLGTIPVNSVSLCFRTRNRRFVWYRSPLYHAYLGWHLQGEAVKLY